MWLARRRFAEDIIAGEPGIISRVELTKIIIASASLMIYLWKTIYIDVERENNQCPDGLLLALAGTDAAGTIDTIYAGTSCERGSFNINFMETACNRHTDVTLSPEGVGTRLAQIALHYALMLRASTALVGIPLQ